MSMDSGEGVSPESDSGTEVICNRINAEDECPG